MQSHRISHRIGTDDVTEDEDQENSYADHDNKVEERGDGGGGARDKEQHRRTALYHISINFAFICILLLIISAENAFQD